MKRLVSEKKYPDGLYIAKDMRLEHQMYEISQFLISNPQLFLFSQREGEMGTIETVELFVLEPSDLEDFIFLQTYPDEWLRFKQQIKEKTISFNFNITLEKNGK